MPGVDKILFSEIAAAMESESIKNLKDGIEENEYFIGTMESNGL